MAAINSGSDLLASNAVLRVKADPLGRYFGVLAGDRAHIYDANMALIDTYACTGCGTLADFDFHPVPGDSSGIVMGGSTGYRVVAPDVTMGSLAMHRWPDKRVTFGPVLQADSSGRGDFWRPQDMLSAASVVNHRAGHIKAGTFDSPITSIPAGFTLTGDGVKTLITNASSTSDEPITISNDSCVVKDIAVRSATGGAGGNQDAILLSGNGNVLVDVTVIDADDDGISITGRFNRITDFRVVDADDRGISFAPILPAHCSS